jgi:hypothetical protein
MVDTLTHERNHMVSAILYSEQAEETAVLVAGDLRVEYVTSQPAATQWIACGLVRQVNQEQGDIRLLVGSGRSELAAMADLESRLRQLRSELSNQPAQG